MMKKLLLFFTMTLSVFTMNAQTNSITITSTIPTTIEVGQTITVDYEYTLDANATDQQIKVGYNELDESDGYVGSVANYSGGLGIGATTSTQTGSLSFTVTAPISADLDTDHKYVLDIIIQATASPWTTYSSATESGTVLTIIPASGVINSVAYNTSAPSTAIQGETITIPISYTTAQDGKLQIGIADTGSDDASNEWAWNGWLVETSIDVTTTTSTPVTTTVDITIPSGAALSSTFTGHHRYRILVDLKSSDFNTTYASAPQIDPFTVTAVAGLNDINANSIVMYPNPVSDRLFIKANLLNANSIQINDVLGRTVRTINNAKNIKSIDVSSLSNGLYILTTDTKKQFKFLKK